MQGLPATFRLLPRHAAPQRATRQAQAGIWRSFVASLALVVFAIIGHAQNYAIPWHTLDGGGVFSVCGTLGQPDAGGPMSGGHFSVTGGFWALPQVVQTPDAPTLTVTPASPGFATLSWTPATPGFVLQETVSLSPPNWTNAPSGATHPVTVPATFPTKFFRLFNP